MKKRKRVIKIVESIIMSLIILSLVPMSVIGKSSNAEEIPSELRQLFAQGICLMDADSGRVLFGKNETEPLPMASTTKIMTLLVTLERGNLDDIVTISKYAASMPRVRLGVREGETYILKDLLYSLMLESHNDVSVAIAEHIAGTNNGEKSSETAVLEFAQFMNEKAIEIGCEDTYYITPNGLDASVSTKDSGGETITKVHSTTPEDLAKIMSYAVTKSPVKEEFLKITQTENYSFSNVDQTRLFSVSNYNAFLNMMEGALSGKTGFTGNAGYCYTGALERDGKTFAVALLACGWPNNKTYKWSDTKALMNYGIDNYQYHSFEEVELDQNKLVPIQVINGQTDKIGEIAYSKLEIVDKDNEEGLLMRAEEEIAIAYDMKNTLEAPVKKGTKIGEITYEVEGEIWKVVPIILAEDIEKINYEWCLRKVLENVLNL